MYEEQKAETAQNLFNDFDDSKALFEEPKKNTFFDEAPKEANSAASFFD